MKHGGDLGEAAERHGHDGEPWLDLSTGINPHAYPLSRPPDWLGWTKLPSEADVAGLTETARKAYRVPPESALVAAPGTQALIQWLPRLAPPGGVAIVGPTYAEHDVAWRLAGRDVRTVATLGEAVQAGRSVVVVNPNNPDGRVVAHVDLAAASEACRRAGGWLVVDESFADVMPDASVVALCRDHPVIMLRSFGKFFGLAGLRLGFAIAPAAIARQIGAALGPWAVSAPAIQAGTLALADERWSVGMRVRLREEAQRLDAVLAGVGLAIVGGTSLYRLVDTEAASQLHERLAERHIWVRRFDWSDTWLRFGLPPDAAGFARLARALAESS